MSVAAGRGLSLVARLALGSAALVASAGAPRAELLFAGAGAVTCDRFLALYRQSPVSAESLFVAWVQGFLSGLNNARLLDGAEPVPIADDVALARDLREGCARDGGATVLEIAVEVDRRAAERRNAR